MPWAFVRSFRNFLAKSVTGKRRILQIIIRPALFFPDSLPESVPRRQNPAGGSADRKDSRIAPDSERTFLFSWRYFPAYFGSIGRAMCGGRAERGRGRETFPAPASLHCTFPYSGT